MSVDPWKVHDTESKKKSKDKTLGDTGQRTMRSYIKASAIATPILLFMLLMLFFSYIAKNEPVANNTSQYSLQQIQGRALATQTVKDWLRQDPPPIPHGEFVSWDDVSPVMTLPQPQDKQLSDEDKAITVNVHHMTIYSPDQQLYYHADVRVVSTEAGSVVVDAPSLIPYVPVDKKNSFSAWQGTLSVGETDPHNIDTAVATWAEAYGSGDGAKLRQVIGDPNQGHSYTPLPKAKVSAAVKNMSALDPEDSQDKPATIIARVEIIFVWLKDDGSPVSGKDGKEKPVSFDVLIHDANTAAPKVVAWGGPGSGPSLKPYVNAVSGVKE